MKQLGKAGRLKAINHIIADYGQRLERAREILTRFDASSDLFRNTATAAKLAGEIAELQAARVALEGENE